MIAKEDLMYRQIFSLKDGARVLVRPLTKDDRQAFLDLFLPVNEEDKRYTRHDINDPAIINGWIDNLDYEKVLPLVAEVSHRIVGCSTLHFREGPYRHRAEVRIFLSKDFRQRGVGSRMLQGLIDMARRRSLYMLEVEVVSDQAYIIKSFQNLGFQTRCIYENAFMLKDGDLRDINCLVLQLRAQINEF
jgi:L-amino acid N-acyltransferase YncA